MLDHRQVVRNEQVGEPELALQIDQQVDDLRTNRHVERRHRFVADDQTGFERERPGNPDTLPLPPGKLVRMTTQRIGPQPDLGDQPLDALAALRR